LPTTTWQVGLREIAQELGFVQFATTTNITTNTYIISTELGGQYDKEDYFIGWWVLIRGVNNDEVIRRVANYEASANRLTVAGAALAAEGGQMTCELHRFHPGGMKNHFNRARQDLFPQVAMIRDLQTVVTGQQQHVFTLPTTLRGKPVRVYLGTRPSAFTVAENMLLNSGFETWTNATTPANWTIAGTGASVNQESETTEPSNYTVLHGSSSARVVVPSSNVTTLLQTINSASSDYTAVGTEGVEINVRCWVYTNTASRVSIRIAGNDGTTHGGTGWELLHYTRSLAATATTVVVGLVATSGSAMAFYADEATAVLGQSEPLDAPWEPLLNWTWVPPVAGGSNGGQLFFPYQLPPKRRLRIVGRDLVSSVSADSDTIEIDGELLQVLYDRTRQLAAREASLNGPPAERSTWRNVAGTFGNRVTKALNSGVGLHMPRSRTNIPDWS
jgi:hypothetical protein